LWNDQSFTKKCHAIRDVRGVPDFGFFDADSAVFGKLIAAQRKQREGKLVLIAHDPMSSPALVKFHEALTQGVLK
jgi:hypothetical protein